MSDYQPVACALHSEYELLAMRRAKVEIVREDDGATLRGIVSDILVHDGAEFLLLECGAGERVEIRLDQIDRYEAL